MNTAEDHGCTATMRSGAGCGVARACRPRNRPLRFFHPDWPNSVARELAPQRGAGDRVAAVEVDVGLVGAELVAVVGHVAPAVEVGRR